MHIRLCLLESVNAIAKSNLLYFQNNYRLNDNSDISQELLETIERYYNDTMTLDERLKFESKLNEDSEFKSQVEDVKTLIIGIENQSLKEQLDVFHEDIPASGSKASSAGCCLPGSQTL